MMEYMSRLEWDELLAAGHAGLQRQAQALKEGKEHKDYAGVKDVEGEWWTHELAAQCELAVAKALGLYWRPSCNLSKSKPDVGHDIQVRTLPKWNGSLVIRDDDCRDHLYVSVYPHNRARGEFAQYFQIMGWAHFDERELGVRDSRQGRPPACFLPVAQLHPITSIPSANRFNLQVTARAEEAPVPEFG